MLPVALLMVLGASYWFTTSRIAEGLRKAVGWAMDAGRQGVLAYRALHLARALGSFDSQPARTAQLAALDSTLEAIEAWLSKVSDRTASEPWLWSDRAVASKFEAVASRWRDTTLPLIRRAAGGVKAKHGPA
jgi:hypothetical protein